MEKSRFTILALDKHPDKVGASLIVCSTGPHGGGGPIRLFPLNREYMASEKLLDYSFLSRIGGER